MCVSSVLIITENRILFPKAPSSQDCVASVNVVAVLRVLCKQERQQQQLQQQFAGDRTLRQKECAPSDRPALLLAAAAGSQMYRQRVGGHYICGSFCPADVASVAPVEMEAVNHFQLTGSHCCMLAACTSTLLQLCTTVPMYILHNCTCT